MSSSKFSYDQPCGALSSVVKEEQIEYGFIGKLQNLKYEYRADIRDLAALERNFCEKFEALNRVHLGDGEFARLLDEIVTPDVFTAARTLRSINAFTREDGTPLNYTLVNIKDWCKNTFEVVNQLRINTDSIANMARTQDGEMLSTLQAGFKYIETESFESTFQGLFSEIDLVATHGKLVEIEEAIAAAKHKHNDFLKELGLSPLP